MLGILIFIHVVVSIALILIVLLQTGKGADMGATFGGGGSQTLFGSTGAGTFLSKATTVAAIVFMLTCLSLAYVSGHRASNSIMEGVEAPPPVEAPKQTNTPADQPTPQTTDNAASSQEAGTADKSE